MTRAMAYAEGRAKGHSIAHSVMAEDFALSLEEVEDAVTDIEDGGRQYSPFEFLARDLNDADDPDMLWEAYDEGVARGAEDAYMARFPNREDTKERQRSRELVPVMA